MYKSVASTLGREVMKGASRWLEASVTSGSAAVVSSAAKAKRVWFIEVSPGVVDGGDTRAGRMRMQPRSTRRSGAAHGLAGQMVQSTLRWRLAAPRRAVTR